MELGHDSVSMNAGHPNTPIVLLPGMNCTADLWSGCELEGAIMPLFDQVDMESQVQTLLDTLPPRFALTGLSLGGVIAMALYRRAPERVTRLCLISTNLKAPSDVQRLGWQAWRDRLAAGDSPRELQHSILKALLGSHKHGQRNSVIEERVLRMGDETGAARLDAQLRIQASRVNEMASLPEVKVPTLVISADLDTICPPSVHRAIAAAVPGAQLISVDAGHLSTIERPSKMGAIIKAWMTG